MEDSSGLSPMVVVVGIVRTAQWVESVIYCKISDVIVPLSGDTEACLVVLHIIEYLCCNLVI